MNRLSVDGKRHTNVFCPKYASWLMIYRWCHLRNLSLEGFLGGRAQQIWPKLLKKYYKIYDTHLYPKVKRYVVYTSVRINRSQHAFRFLGIFNEQSACLKHSHSNSMVIPMDSLITHTYFYTFTLRMFKTIWKLHLKI